MAEYEALLKSLFLYKRKNLGHPHGFGFQQTTNVQVYTEIDQDVSRMEDGCNKKVHLEEIENERKNGIGLAYLLVNYSKFCFRYWFCV